MRNTNNLNNLDFSSFLRTFNDVKKITIMRSLMNQIIEQIEFKGRILDIGGGRNSNYSKIFENVDYISVNIDEKILPHKLVNINQTFPLPDNDFDCCVLFNVLEHIYDWDFIFKEVKRLIVNNGKIYIIIPFLYPIHGAPSDFKRVTSNYLEKFLNIKKFCDIDIHPIAYGPMTNCNIVGYNHQKIRGLLASICVILDKLFQIFFKRKLLQYSAKNPLFYYVEAKNLKE